MRRLRYTARVAVGETAFDLLQVSDGRMMWTHSSPNAPPKRIILDQVLQSIPSSLQYPDTRPDIHLLLAVGGQAELARMFGSLSVGFEPSRHGLQEMHRSTTSTATSVVHRRICQPKLD
jgi:hypothetical protein